MRPLIWRLEVLAYDVLAAGLGLLGFRRASALGGWLLRKVGPLTSKQKILSRNLEIAFPDRRDRDGLARQAWDNIGRTFFEFPLMHRFDATGPFCRVEGLEHVHALRDAGKPCVVITGHFANWEVMAAVLTQSGLDVAITYRRINNRHLDTRVRSTRAAYGTKLLVPKSGPAGARHLLDAVAGGQSIALLNDQKFNTGLSVPFFGTPAMTAPGPVRLSLATGAPILWMTCRRVGAEFVVTIAPPFHPTDTGDRHADVRAGVEAIVTRTEAAIAAAPAQWFWVHRRWPKDLYD